MLQTNPEIDHVIEEATQLAMKLSHEYVTLEHVFLSMIRYEPFRDLLTDYGADVDALESDLDAYLLSQVEAYMQKTTAMLITSWSSTASNVLNL